MPDETKPLYAQFDGDEIDGKIYKVGEKIEPLDTGTRVYLEALGRIAATKPAHSIEVPSSDKPIADMTRSELEVTARNMIDLSDYDDEQLRNEIESRRKRSAQMAEAHGGQVSTVPDDAKIDETGEADRQAAQDRQNAYDALKEKPLDSMKTDELKLVADVEGVDLADATNNPQRVAAIQAKRDA